MKPTETKQQSNEATASFLSTRARCLVVPLITTLLLASCASSPPITLEATVGPALAKGKPDHNGFLQVYNPSSSRSVYDDDRGRLIYNDYQIDTPDGTLFQKVINGTDAPRKVRLPKGNYIVIADSEAAGMVRVPVAIVTGRLTAVHLEGEKDWEDSTATLSIADLVRLPNGRAIGYRAEAQRH